MDNFNYEKISEIEQAFEESNSNSIRQNELAKVVSQKSKEEQDR